MLKTYPCTGLRLDPHVQALPQGSAPPWREVIASAGVVCPLWACTRLGFPSQLKLLSFQVQSNAINNHSRHGVLRHGCNWLSRRSKRQIHICRRIGKLHRNTTAPWGHSIAWGGGTASSVVKAFAPSRSILSNSTSHIRFGMMTFAHATLRFLASRIITCSLETFRFLGAVAMIEKCLSTTESAVMPYAKSEGTALTCADAVCSYCRPQELLASCPLCRVRTRKHAKAFPCWVTSEHSGLAYKGDGSSPHCECCCFFHGASSSIVKQWHASPDIARFSTHTCN